MDFIFIENYAKRIKERKFVTTFFGKIKHAKKVLTK